MRKPFKLITGLALIFLVSCNETVLDEPIDCLEVKVITELCNQAVIQLVSPNNAQVQLGTIEVDGVNYDNVFKTFFHCQQMPQVPLDGSTFKIRPVDETTWQSLITQPEECAVCEPLLAGHLPFSHVEIIDNCSANIER